MANLLFKQMEASKADIDEIMECWSLSLMGTDRTGPFSDHDHLFNSIDAIPFGSAPWKCFQTADDPTLPPTAPSWMKERYQIWYRDPDVVIANMLSNPDFAGEFDTRPYVHLGADGKRRWSEFMSGNYSWNHAVRLSLRLACCTLLNHYYRQRSIRMIQQRRASCTFQSLLGAIRQPSLS